MKRVGGAIEKLIVALATVGAVSLYALDKLPTASCHDRDNLRLLKRCDPYAVHLLKVGEAQLLPMPPQHRILLAKKSLSPALPYYYERRLSFQKLVERYIDYEESILTRREMLRKKAMHLHEAKSSRSKKAIVESEQNVSEPTAESSAAKQPSPGVPENGDLLTVVQKTKPLKKEEERYPEKLISVKKPPSISKPKPSGPRLPVIHTVAPGETFSGLARFYQTTIYDIRRWNGLKKDHLLKIGEKLTIHPGKKTPPEKMREALRRENFGHYTVQKGDTVIGLSRRFGVKKREILFLNRLKKGRKLRIGRKVMLPLTQKKIDTILAREKKARFKYVSDKRFRHKIRVVATAYTSHRGQTDRTPFLAAWNNRIRPGMKIIAVSPDLIRKYGITNGIRVKISGLPGTYVVRDKMNKRLRNHIDIYMGTNRRKALRWGRRRVVLYW